MDKEITEWPTNNIAYLFASYSFNDKGKVDDIETKLINKHVKFINPFDERRGSSEEFAIKAGSKNFVGFIVFNSRDYMNGKVTSNEYAWIKNQLSIGREAILGILVKLDDFGLGDSEVLFQTVKQNSASSTVNFVVNVINRFTKTEKPLAALSDDALMSRVAAYGDIKAFSILHERFYPYIRRTVNEAFSSLNAEFSDFACQRVINRFWDKMGILASSCDRTEIRSWINDQALEAAVYVKEAGDSINTSSYKEGNQNALLIQTEIEKLNDQEKKYVDLRFSSHMTTDEIARELRMPERAVNMLHHKVLKQISAALGRTPDE